VPEVIPKSTVNGAGSALANNSTSKSAAAAGAIAALAAFSPAMVYKMPLPALLVVAGLNIKNWLNFPKGKAIANNTRSNAKQNVSSP
jgi:hypothetical protein